MGVGVRNKMERKKRGLGKGVGYSNRHQSSEAQCGSHPNSGPGAGSV